MELSPSQFETAGKKLAIKHKVFVEMQEIFRKALGWNIDIAASPHLRLSHVTNDDEDLNERILDAFGEKWVRNSELSPNTFLIRMYFFAYYSECYREYLEYCTLTLVKYMRTYVELESLWKNKDFATLENDFSINDFIHDVVETWGIDYSKVPYYRQYDELMDFIPALFNPLVESLQDEAAQVWVDHSLAPFKDALAVKFAIGPFRITKDRIGVFNYDKKRITEVYALLSIKNLVEETKKLELFKKDHFLHVNFKDGKHQRWYCGSGRSGLEYREKLRDTILNSISQIQNT